MEEAQEHNYIKTLCWIQTHNAEHHLWNYFDDDTNMTKIAAETMHNVITKLSEFD